MLTIAEECFYECEEWVILLIGEFFIIWEQFYFI